VNETTAQEASGATIAAWDDLKVDPFFTRRALARSSRIDTACLVERLAPGAGQEAVDAAGPVDAQNAPTGPWKTADGFPQAPTAIIVTLIKEKEGSYQPRPATGQRQLPSSAAVASGTPLLTLRRQK
jgi:hypothetical protein